MSPQKNTPRVFYIPKAQRKQVFEEKDLFGACLPLVMSQVKSTNTRRPLASVPFGIVLVRVRQAKKSDIFIQKLAFSGL